MKSLARFWPDLRARADTYTFVCVLTFVVVALPLVVPVITGRIVDGPVAHGNVTGLWGRSRS